MQHKPGFFNRKIRDTLQSRQNPRRILSCNPFGANFAIAKFGIKKDATMKKNAVMLTAVSAGWLLICAPSVCAQTIPLPPGDQLNYPFKYGNSLTNDLITSNVLPINTELPEEQMIFRLKYNDLYINSLAAPNTRLIKLRHPERKPKPTVDKALLNQLTTKPKVDEKEQIRQSWERAFGVDVWDPYYRTKDAENWVKKKASFKVYKVRCKPEFSRDSMCYNCKTAF